MHNSTQCTYSKKIVKKYDKTNMMNTFPAFLLHMRILAVCFAMLCFTSAQASSISLVQVSEDVTYLASDDLKGRGNFSPEISQAANYIAKRFEQSGLKTADNISTQGYLQKYQVSRQRPEKLSLVVNGKTIAFENLTMASTIDNVSWVLEDNLKSSEFKIHSLGTDEDIRALISNINKQGGEHLVLLNFAHKEMFKRYQQYFGRGITKLIQPNNSKTQGGTLVMALYDLRADKVEHINFTGKNSLSTSELTNVVAVLPGTTKPEEIILYSAHYDHLGEKDAKTDIIYNGADDDASGTAAVMNIAQYYAKQGNNARTLMFAAFSAEEIGGFGSKYFSTQLDPDKITAMINIEMIGKPSKFGAGTVWMTGMERSSLGKQLNDALLESGKQIYKDPYPEQGLFYRSDNATLARLGVPAHSFSSTQLDKDEHYHQVSDDLSSLDLPSLHKVIESLAVATQALVNGTMTPSRIDASTVKNKGFIY